MTNPGSFEYIKEKLPEKFPDHGGFSACIDVLNIDDSGDGCRPLVHVKMYLLRS